MIGTLAPELLRVYSRRAMLTPLLALLVASSGFPGTWQTADGSGLVRIEPCGARICGRIVRVLDPRAPATDRHNPDPALRNRPVLGLTVLSNFAPAPGNMLSGRAYDPKTGRSYRAILRLNPNGTLRVTGCVLVVCRSQTWTRRR